MWLKIGESNIQILQSKIYFTTEIYLTDLIDDQEHHTGYSGHILFNEYLSLNIYLMNIK